VLNWDKCHFMVKQGIVLGHVISHMGIEVDKVKVDLISNLPPPCTSGIGSVRPLNPIFFFKFFRNS
jgi:hypothetical protein